MRLGEAVEGSRVGQVDARAHDVLQRGAGLGERVLDDLEAALRLPVGVGRRIGAVGHHRSRPRDERPGRPRARPGSSRRSARTGIPRRRSGAPRRRLVSPTVEALEQIDSWPAPTAAVAVVTADGVAGERGAADVVLRWASVTKLLTAYAALIAAEEGVLDLDEPAGPRAPRCATSSPMPQGSPSKATRRSPGPAERRIYSNSGFDLLGELLAERAEMPFADYSQAAVLDPLGLAGAELRAGRRRDVGDARRPDALRPRAARAHARRAGDARRGDRGRLPGARRRPPGPRPAGAERLGPRLRAQGRASARIGRARPTPRAPSATSAEPGRSSGSTRMPARPARASPTSSSASGPWPPGLRSRTRYWASSSAPEPAARSGACPRRPRPGV